MKLISSLDLENYLGYTVARDVYDNGRLVIRGDTVIDYPMIDTMSYIHKPISIFIFSDEEHSDIKTILKEETVRVSREAIDDIFENYAVRDKDFMNTKDETHKSLMYLIDQVISSNFCMYYMEEAFIRNRRIFNNSLRTTVLAVYLGVRAGLSKKALYELGLGAAIHDIGKLRLFSEYPVLCDDTHFYSFHEYELMKTHPIIGYNELKRIDEIPIESKKIVLFHNVWENFESSYSDYRKSNMSYPCMYENTKITSSMKDILVDIVQVSILFNSLTSNDGIDYPEQFTKLDAFNIIEGYSDKMLNPRVVKLFTRSISPFSIGERVLLNNNKEVTVEEHTDDVFNPIIRSDKEKRVDLRKHKDLSVVESVK